MKRLRRSRTTRLTAQILSVLLLVPYLLGGLSVRPASAQTEAVDVVVMDFNNRAGVGGTLLGRTAASAVALELQGSGRWEPVSDRAVQAALNELNLRPPFDRIALTRLAQRVDANMVVIGEVVSVRTTENPAQATATIAVQAMDRASQEMINGAVATASSAPRIGYTGDMSVLIDEALSKAAFLARQSMERRQLVEGTVMNTSVVGDRYEALLNIGARQGVKRGMRFIIVSGAELVGRGQARTVDADFSTLSINENFRGVKPEDRVRSVFELPNLPPEEYGVGGVRRSALELQPQEGTEPPRPGDVVAPETRPPTRERSPGRTRTARMIAGGLILLGIVAIAGSRGGTTAFRTQAENIEFGADTAIRVTWSRPRQVSSEDVVQYQILRTSAVQGECVVGVVVGDIREFIDTTSAEPDARFQADIIERDVDTGGGTGGGGGGGGGIGGTGVRALTVSAQQVQCPDEQLALVPGRTYTYRVQTVFVPAVSPGDDTDVSESVSQPSASSNQVTFLSRPTLTAPANNAADVDLTAVNFQFTSAAGPSSYTVQVSADPNFASGVADVAVVPNGGRQGGQTLSTGPINIAARFGGRSVLFWRVVGRDPQGGQITSLPSSFVPATGA